MRILLRGIFFLLFISNVTFAQQPISPEIFNEPIIEGKGAAGINLGDTEVKVVEKMGGLPHVVQGFGKPHKTLTYGNMTEKGGVFINIFMENNSVVGVEIQSIPTVQGHLYKGKTQSGFQFGDSLGKIKELYGEPYKAHNFGNKNKILWYKKDGVILEYFSDKEDIGEGAPSVIVIMKPNSGIPPQIKERGGPEGLWK